MVGDTGDDVDEDLIGIDENVITMDKSGDSDEALGEGTANAVLEALDSATFASYDEEAVKFLIDSGVGNLWKMVYLPDIRADAPAAAGDVSDFAVQIHCCS